MTEIICVQNNRHFKLMADNHAGSTEVCAGVSALLYALEGTLMNHDSAICHYSTLEPGHAVIECIAMDELVAEDFRMALIGLMQIREGHPDDIAILQNIFD